LGGGGNAAHEVDACVRGGEGGLKKQIAGSANVLGNPVSLWAHVATGVKDFFSQPARSISGEGSLGEGLKRVCYLFSTSFIYFSWRRFANLMNSLGDDVAASKFCFWRL
jgi:hypothetical protein